MRAPKRRGGVERSFIELDLSSTNTSSMKGLPATQAREVVDKAIAGLRSDDTSRVIEVDNSSSLTEAVADSSDSTIDRRE